MTASEKQNWHEGDQGTVVFNVTFFGGADIFNLDF